VAEEAGEVSSEVSGDAAAALLMFDGGCEGLDARGERGAVGDVAGDSFPDGRRCGRR